MLSPRQMKLTRGPDRSRWADRRVWRVWDVVPVGAERRANVEAGELPVDLVLVHFHLNGLAT